MQHGSMGHPRHAQLAAVAIRAYGPRTHTRRAHPGLQAHRVLALLLGDVTFCKSTQGSTRRFWQLRSHDLRRPRHRNVLKEGHLHICC